MERHTTSNTTEATVSVNNNGVYVGVKARKKIGAGYNDEVNIHFPKADMSVKGELTSASIVGLSNDIKSFLKEVGEHAQGATYHLTAIVEKTGASWYDARDVDEERYNLASNTLEARRTR